MDDKILRDWDYADQYLNDNLNNVGSSLNGIVSEIDHIKGTAEGQFVYDTETKMTKVVPDGVNKGIVKEIGGKTVKTKNLIPYPYWRPSGYTTGGATFTCDDYGVITITTGDAGVTGNCFFSITRDSEGHIANVVSGKTYALRATSNVEATNVRFNYKYYNASTGKERDPGRYREVNNTITFVYEPQENEVLLIQVYCIVGAKPNGEVIKIQLEEGSEATEYEPYFDGLHNAAVDECEIISGNNKVIENERLSSDGLPVNDITRSRSDVFPENSVSDIVMVSVKSKVGKVMDCALIIFRNNTKIIDTGWSANELIYTLTDRDFDFAAIVIRYHDNSTIIKNDISLSLNCGIRKEISLSDIIKDLPDYGCSAGDVYNYIDFERGVYVHKVGSVDMGTLNYTATTNAIGAPLPKKAKTPVTNIIGVYEYIASNSAFIASDKAMRINSDQITIAFRDSLYPNDSTGATQFKAAMSGITLNYEFDDEEIIDISDLITPFSVEPNGTVTFENKHNLDVPNTLIYEKEMK